MAELTVTIKEFFDDAQPGWVRAIFYDIDRKQWSIVEKIPIVTEDDLDEHSHYPQQGLVATSIRETYKLDGQEIAVIDLSQPDSICAEDGTEVFHVFKEQLIVK
ncbi:hypothetical protein LRS06_14055 [Hymenobacter sp. J193]|uniref:hypothetical protein n=1 Tax=Hymenobacter sp. J193 TaxID=2898429 RepID=UPI0021516B6D|nr:hypothetical protein [Hymenobacter sp. J193]MCR5888868.1 hypothetical protein [Hymenobacter sp. J193]